MIIREINGLKIEVNEYEANELFLPEEFFEKNEKALNGDIEEIKKGIYAWNMNDTYMPLSILWELTNRCNFSCPFCYINNGDAQRYPYKSFTYYKSIIDDLIKRGMLFCCLTGGECLLHPCFTDIYTYLKQRGVLVTVFTNAFEINIEILNLWRQYKPYKVEISIYGMREEVFVNTTKCSYKNASAQVLNNILELKNAGINVRCKTPINCFTEGDIEEINKWCVNNEIDYYTSEELLPTYSGKRHNEYLASEETLEKCKERHLNILRKRKDCQYGLKKAWDCSAGKYAGVISADGCFYPCMSCVGIEKFRYPFGETIDVAIDSHIETVRMSRNKQLCNGCEWCNICEQCVVTVEKESADVIAEKCRQIRLI